MIVALLHSVHLAGSIKAAAGMGMRARTHYAQPCRQVWNNLYRANQHKPSSPVSLAPLAIVANCTKISIWGTLSASIAYSYVYACFFKCDKLSVILDLECVLARGVLANNK